MNNPKARRLASRSFNCKWCGSGNVPGIRFIGSDESPVAPAFEALCLDCLCSHINSNRYILINVSAKGERPESPDSSDGPDITTDDDTSELTNGLGDKVEVQW